MSESLIERFVVGGIGDVNRSDQVHADAVFFQGGDGSLQTRRVIVLDYPDVFGLGFRRCRRRNLAEAEAGEQKKKGYYCSKIHVIQLKMLECEVKEKIPSIHS